MQLRRAVTLVLSRTHGPTSKLNLHLAHDGYCVRMYSPGGYLKAREDAHDMAALLRDLGHDVTFEDEVRADEDDI